MTAAWPEALPRTIYYPDLGVGQLLDIAAAAYGDRPAVTDGTSSRSFAALRDRADLVAGALTVEGVEPGDVVLLHLRNSTWFLEAYYGCMRHGATVALANPLLPPTDLAGLISSTGAVLAFSETAHIGPLLAACPGTSLSRVVVPGDPGDHDLVQSAEEFLGRAGAASPGATDRALVTPGAGEQLAHLAPTGGTTGQPKYARVLHRNVVANVLQITAWRAGSVLTTSEREVRLTPLTGADAAPVRLGDGATVFAPPLFHAHALINVSFLLLSGTTVVLMERFDPDEFVDTVDRYRATYLTGSPALWNAVLASAEKLGGTRPFVRVISSGAAPLDVVTLDRLADAFPQAVVSEGYGLTEATCVVSGTCLLPGAERRRGTVGVPVFDTEISLRDPEDGSPVPPGAAGELWVRGPQVTDGYHGRPEETTAQFVDGWLRTGDIARLDDAGHIRIESRLKDMLIYKGYNVYPRQLEDLLARHPEVAAVSVVGRPDDRIGELPVAFVVPHADSRPVPAELMRWVNDQVMPYQKIREVHLLEQLPVSTTGKVLKRDLLVLLAELDDKEAQRADAAMREVTIATLVEE